MWLKIIDALKLNFPDIFNTNIFGFNNDGDFFFFLRDNNDGDLKKKKDKKDVAMQ